MTELDVVVVVWRDAHSDGQGWQRYDETDPEPCLVTTVGYLLRKGRGKKPKHFTVAQSAIGDEYVDSLLHIPREMVVRSTKIGSIDVADSNSTTEQKRNT